MSKPDLPYLLAEHDMRPIDLARALGVDKITVSRWIEKGIPVHRIEDVERATGISRAALRPDLAEMFGGAQ